MLPVMDVGRIARSSGAYDLAEPTYSRLQRRRWEKSGRPLPAPSAVKREILRQYGDAHGLRVLVETGTYKADTVRALRRDFDEIHSVEIDRALFDQAVIRCRRQSNAHLHLGDSAQVIAEIVAKLDVPALFWLDAHYSGAGTGGEDSQPVVDEVRQIVASRRGHVLLIDDVREFGSAKEYPQLDAVATFAVEHGYEFSVSDDVARLVPTSTARPLHG